MPLLIDQQRNRPYTQPTIGWRREFVRPTGVLRILSWYLLRYLSYLNGYQVMACNDLQGKSPLDILEFSDSDAGIRPYRS